MGCGVLTEHGNIADAGHVNRETVAGQAHGVVAEGIRRNTHGFYLFAVQKVRAAVAKYAE
nr:MAG TPA: hypothetical protein [Caudoviricetes sp.]